MPFSPHRYLVALGSNLGDRLAFLGQAGQMVGMAIGEVTAQADYYETKPVGAADQPFLNSALVVVSVWPPETVLSKLLEIEARLGRVRRERWGNRVIDLDILMWQQRHAEGHWVTGSWDSPALQIPHPHLLQRDFALVPAAAIAANWWHPAAAMTLADAVLQRGFTLPPPQPYSL